MVSIPPAALQFGGSLIAILVLAWLVKRMGLGKAPEFDTDTEVIAAAREVSDGFEAVEVARDRSGRGALLTDEAGRVMLLRQHGVHFAGRILTSAASVRLDGDRVFVDTGERRFGSFELALDDPSAWVERINAVKSD